MKCDESMEVYSRISILAVFSLAIHHFGDGHQVCQSFNFSESWSNFSDVSKSKFDMVLLKITPTVHKDTWIYQNINITMF